jgi:hypothetical protein
LLIVTAAVSAIVFTDYGITWDEGVQSTYGELVLDYFASGGRETRANEYFNLFYYGPLFESVTAAAYRVAGGLKYEIRHAAIGLAALLTLVAVWRFGRKLDSPAIPFFAMLALVMMPRFTGHAFNNSKDIPFACGFAWAMLAIGRLLTGRRWGWPDVLLCGAATGVAMSLRVGAAMLLFILAGGILASIALSPDERRTWREQLGNRVIKTAVIVATAWTIMVVGWPWAHAAPLTRPFAALAELSSFSFSYTTYFAGEFVRSTELPRYYLPLYLTIVTPLALLALAAWGFGATVREQLARPHESRSLMTFLLQLWLLLPIVYVVVNRPNVYDGIRHFLFVLPALALFCGCGAASLLRTFGCRKIAIGALVVLVASPLPALAMLHPYQSSFFNGLVGGIHKAWRSYDTDYWASSYAEAMRWVLDQGSAGESFAIAVACNSHNRPCAEYYLQNADKDAPRVTLHCVWDGTETVPDDVRYFVGTLRYGKAGTFFPDWPVDRRIGRRGAVFSVIKRNPSTPG